eukprot:591001-Pleurochrysis_carterae.AAC.1
MNEQRGRRHGEVKRPNSIVLCDAHVGPVKPALFTINQLRITAAVVSAFISARQFESRQNAANGLSRKPQHASACRQLVKSPMDVAPDWQGAPWRCTTCTLANSPFFRSGPGQILKRDRFTDSPIASQIARPPLKRPGPFQESVCSLLSFGFRALSRGVGKNSRCLSAPAPLERASLPTCALALALALAPALALALAPALALVPTAPNMCGRQASKGGFKS